MYGARTYYLTCDALAPGAALSPLLQAALAAQTGEEDAAACVDQVVVLRDIVRSGEQFLRADAASAGVGEEEEDSADEEDRGRQGAGMRETKDKRDTLFGVVSTGQLYRNFSRLIIEDGEDPESESKH
jgi:hypothetical protein